MISKQYCAALTCKIPLVRYHDNILSTSSCHGDANLMSHTHVKSDEVWRLLRLPTLSQSWYFNQLVLIIHTE